MAKPQLKSPLASFDAPTNSNELAIISQQIVLDKNFVVYGAFENPLFLAKDVAEWIEYLDSSAMIKLVDVEENLIRTMFGSGQNREQWFVSEDGLYEILFQSRKPIAKQFKKEVKKILRNCVLRATCFHTMIFLPY